MLLGHSQQTLAGLDFAVLTFAFLSDHAQGRNFESLSHKRVTDLLDSFAYHAAVLEDYQVHSLFYVTLFEGVEVGQGLTSCRSENKACQALLLGVFDGPGNKADVDSTLDGPDLLFTHRKNSLVITITVNRVTERIIYDGCLVTQVNDCALSLNKLEHLEAVFHDVDVCYHVLDGFALLLNELLLFLNVRVKRVKQKVDSSTFFFSNHGDSCFVVLDVLGFDDADAGFLAFF